jgi:hypothetical protein
MIIKHLEKMPSVFERYLINMNIPLRKRGGILCLLLKREEDCAYLKV